MAIEAIFRISGKVGTKFCFKENLEKHTTLNLVQVERVF
jgi:hypothetical protein